MKGPLLFIAAALSAIGAVLAGPAQTGTGFDVRVLSANVRYATASDGDHAWDKRAPMAIEALVAAKPDVLGLQEALDHQVEAIHRAFPGHAVIGEGRDRDGAGEWCALLVDSERFAIRASGTFRLSPEDRVGAMGWDAACTRIATWAELADRKDPARPFLVINTHFDHVGKEARRNSAELISRWRAARQERRGRLPVLVMGDLNATPTSPPLKTLNAAGLGDTWSAFKDEPGPEGTFHGFKGGRDGRRIDYVLADPAWTIKDAWIDWTEEANRFPSDHRFVGAVLRLAR